MGIFSGKGFVGSCFRGWGSSNMAVQVFIFVLFCKPFSCVRQ